jgi:hypothetical protein
VAQEITPDDRIAHNQYPVTILEKLEKANKFLRKTMLSDKATTHISQKVNKQKVYIWGSEHPHTTVKDIRESLKVS